MISYIAKFLSIDNRSHNRFQLLDKVAFTMYFLLGEDVHYFSELELCFLRLHFSIKKITSWKFVFLQEYLHQRRNPPW